MAKQLEDLAIPPIAAPPGGSPWRFDVSPRWVRVRFGGETVADSRRARLLLDAQRLPVYYFPRDDVRTDLLSPTAHHTTSPTRGEARYFTVTAGGRTAPDAAWEYGEPPAGGLDLRGHVAFYWNRMDAWFEEDEEVFAHPRDPYHRVDAVASSRHAEVRVGGELIATSSRPFLLFETGLPTRYYFAPEHVRMDLLEPSDRRTRCAYKGQARYFSLRLHNQAVPDIAWTYPTPHRDCPAIRGLVAFFNERSEIRVDGEVQAVPTTPWSGRDW